MSDTNLPGSSHYKPTKSPEGTMWMDTSTDIMYISKGGYWHAIGGIQQAVDEKPRLSWWQRIVARIRSFFV